MCRLATLLIVGAVFLVGTQAFSHRRLFNISGVPFVVEQDSFEQDDSDEVSRFNPKLHDKLQALFRTLTPKQQNSRQFVFDLDSVEDDNDRSDFDSLEDRRFAKRSAPTTPKTNVEQPAKDAAPFAPVAQVAKDVGPEAQDIKNDGKGEQASKGGQKDSRDGQNSKGHTDQHQKGGNNRETEVKGHGSSSQKAAKGQQHHSSSKGSHGKGSGRHRRSLPLQHDISNTLSSPSILRFRPSFSHSPLPLV